jgi:hypothetical protein
VRGFALGEPIVGEVVQRPRRADGLGFTSCLVAIDNGEPLARGVLVGETVFVLALAVLAPRDRVGVAVGLLVDAAPSVAADLFPPRRETTVAKSPPRFKKEGRR